MTVKLISNSILINFRKSEKSKNVSLTGQNVESNLKYNYYLTNIRIELIFDL